MIKQLALGALLSFGCSMQASWWKGSFSNSSNYNNNNNNTPDYKPNPLTQHNINYVREEEKPKGIIEGVTYADGSPVLDLSTQEGQGMKAQKDAATLAASRAEIADRHERIARRNTWNDDPGYLKSIAIREAEKAITREEFAKLGYICPDNNNTDNCTHHPGEMIPKGPNHDIVTPPVAPNTPCNAEQVKEDARKDEQDQKARDQREQAINDIRAGYYEKTGRVITARDAATEYDSANSEDRGGCSVQ